MKFHIVLPCLLVVALLSLTAAIRYSSHSQPVRIDSMQLAHSLDNNPVIITAIYPESRSKVLVVQAVVMVGCVARENPTYTWKVCPGDPDYRTVQDFLPGRTATLRAFSKGRQSREFQIGTYLLFENVH